MTGIVNLSPSWFSQGHECPGELLHASADIQLPENLKYLQNLILANTIVVTIYAVVQPDLFEFGLAIFEELADHAQELNESISNALSAWATPFTSLSMILDRETITHQDIKGYRTHQDIKGYRESFNLLLTIGHYTGGWFHLPGLGFSLLYDLGTVVTLAGNVLQHGVCPVAGDRPCLAHFWHRKVGERLGVKEPQWVTMEDLTQNLLSSL